MTKAPDTGIHGWSFEETSRRQLRQGLAMTPEERLRWLERTKQELQPLVGLATRTARPDAEPEGGTD
ncbi:MAG TPA: hypothetical protein VHQ65_00035 [Thermoanaerobaculia bacterium]|nr:hypothetical protein [Thermoanaerobaculia bacterium]